jgi:hypothetical protein
VLCWNLRESGAVPADFAALMPALLSMLLSMHVPGSGNVAQPRLLVVLALTHLCLISLCRLAMTSLSTLTAQTA